jgi:hypothetical protein
MVLSLRVFAERKQRSRKDAKSAKNNLLVGPSFVLRALCVFASDLFLLLREDQQGANLAP